MATGSVEKGKSVGRPPNGTKLKKKTQKVITSG
jgi:hypothetical protein